MGASRRVVSWFGYKFKFMSLAKIEWQSREILYLEIENLGLGNSGDSSLERILEVMSRSFEQVVEVVISVKYREIKDED